MNWGEGESSLLSIFGSAFPARLLRAEIPTEGVVSSWPPVSFRGEKRRCSSSSRPLLPPPVQGSQGSSTSLSSTKVSSSVEDGDGPANEGEGRSYDKVMGSIPSVRQWAVMTWDYFFFLQISCTESQRCPLIQCRSSRLNIAFWRPGFSHLL